MKKLFLFFSALICIVAAQAQEPVTTAPADTTLKAKVVFANMDHDYGTINKGADGDCVFKFKNEGQAPLVLSNVKASCGCTTPSWTKDPVMPGASGEIKVHYDTNRVGSFSKTITVSSNAENATVMLRILGTVNAPVETTPPATN
jgi:hypothetical protein